MSQDSGQVVISNSIFKVTVSPENGADIRQIIYLPKMISLLLETGWDRNEFDETSSAPGSESNFLAKYQGGWQLMIPNAGFNSQLNETAFGYHGEAWEREWKVTYHSDSEIHLFVQLDSMPLSILRKLTLDHSEFLVTDEVTNNSTDEVQFLWGHHPAFSEEFLADSEINIPASTLRVLSDSNPTVDDVLPNFLTKNNGEYRVNNLFMNARSFLGIFSNFAIPQLSIKNKKFNFEMEFTWSHEVFPHMWFWLENRKLTNFPWNKSIATLGLEPCSTKSNLGIADSLQDLRNLVRLSAGQRKTSKVSLKFS